MKRKIGLIIVILMGLGLVAAPTLAQQAEVITATVDRHQATTDDLILLTVVVNGAANARPELPIIDGFQVSGRSQSTQMSIIKGSITTSGSFQYQLQPTKTGTLTIPPLSIQMNGQTFSTNPIQVQITQGTGPSQSVQNLGQANEPGPAPTTLTGQDLFTEAEVDNETPFQGEQVTYTFRFYQAVNLSGQPSYQPPDFTGLWNDVDLAQGNYTTDAAGRTYHVTELNTILFPAVAGEVVIDPTTLVIPGGLWSRDTTLQTQPVKLEVKPLPAGAPLSFKGAVGKFDMTTAVDNQKTEVGEPITLNVNVAGQGNIGTMGDPQWPDDPNWRAFENDSSTFTEVINGRLRGNKSYERLLVPTNNGQLTFPSIAYSYFDPELEQYETLTSEPVPIDVSGTAVNYTPQLPGDEQAGQPDSGLRPLKNITSIENNGSLLVNSPLYWLLWLLPVGLVFGQYALQKRKIYLEGTADQRRRSRAAKKATKALQQVRTGEDPYGNTGAILTTYLEERLNTPLRGMTSAGRLRLFHQFALSERTIANIEICLAQSEAGKYAPGTAGRDIVDLIDQVRQVIEKIEKSLVNYEL